MNLGRLTLTLLLTGGLSLSAAEALAQEATPAPKDKPKTEGEEEPGLEENLEKLREFMEEREEHTEELENSFERLKRTLNDYKKYLNEQRYNIYESMRLDYLEKRRKGKLREVNKYKNSRWVEIMWITNDDLELSYLQDAFWLGGMVRKRLNGEYFHGFRLYLRKEGKKEVPFLEVVVDYEFGEDNKKPVLRLFDITQEEYEKIMEETKNVEGREQWYFKQKVMRTYKSFMREYFENSEHSNYNGTFGDILAELKKRINDPDIDVKKWLLAAVPGYKGYEDKDKVPIQRPKKKQPEEQKK